MGGARGDMHGIADGNEEASLPQGHDAVAGGDVIQLLAQTVPVQQGARSRRHRGLGQALLAVAMDVGMHQFAYFRAVLGAVGGNVGAGGMKDRAHGGSRAWRRKHAATDPPPGETAMDAAGPAR